MSAMMQDLPAESGTPCCKKSSWSAVFGAPAVQVCWHIGTGQPQRTASAGTCHDAPASDTGLHTRDGWMATSEPPPRRCSPGPSTSGCNYRK